MPNPIRPKRAGEDFARSQRSGGGSHGQSAKKPRFDARNPSTLAADGGEDDMDEEDQIILDADVIGKSGAQVKRNAVNIDGYESDSDNDNFDSRAADKARAQDQQQKKKKSQAEEENDMFADLDEDMQGTADGDEDEDLRREGKKNKKAVKFLDPTEIEGQVMNSTSGGHVSADLHVDGEAGNNDGEQESDSESSGDEEERDQLPTEMEEADAAEIGAGGKKQHAPRLDAFNLKAEEEEGRYDESGNFVRRAHDPEAASDNWLEGLSKRDMKKAREAQEAREGQQRRKALEEDAVLTSDLLSRLIEHLEIGESALEALQRLNKGKKAESKVPKWKLKKQQKDKMDVDSQNGESIKNDDPAEVARKRCVEEITGAADALYTRGQHEIYDTERELLMRQYTRDTGETWKPKAVTTQPAESSGITTGDSANHGANWEYRWSDARDGGQHHGPYQSEMMKAWSQAGYFGEGVEFRRIGTAEWSRVLDVK